MRRWAAGIAVAVLAVPLAYWAVDRWTYSGRAPRAVAVGWDRMARLVLGYDPYRRCALPLETLPSGTQVASSLPDRDCLDFGPARRFNGVYFDEFEGQLLIEGTPKGPPFREPSDHVWLEFDERTVYDANTKALLRPDDSGKTRVFMIEFIGRKTARKGQYGHMGASQHEVLVNRVVGARKIHETSGYAGADLLIRPQF